MFILLTVDMYLFLAQYLKSLEEKCRASARYFVALEYLKSAASLLVICLFHWCLGPLVVYLSRQIILPLGSWECIHKIISSVEVTEFARYIVLLFGNFTFFCLDLERDHRKGETLFKIVKADIHIYEIFFCL